MTAPLRYNAGGPLAGVVMNDDLGNAMGTAANPVITTSGTSGSGVAQGSTTAGQNGGLFQGAVTTAKPTYTTGTTNPISLTTSGEIRAQVGGTVLSANGAPSPTGFIDQAGGNRPTGAALFGYNGTTSDSLRTITAADGTGLGILSVAESPSSAAGAGLASGQTTVAAGSIILKASAGNLYGVNATSGASAGYLLVYDSATVPADGTTTPRKTYVMAANSTIAFDFDIPLRFAAGIVLVFSTTGPFTKTISATAFLSGDFA